MLQGPNLFGIYNHILRFSVGFYIAIQSHGVCMSLISLRVYYHYCPDTNDSLASFPMTLSSEQPGDIRKVTGECVANAAIWSPHKGILN